MQRQILSVSELNDKIKELIDGEPLLGDVCVRGELSNYKMYQSGHHYFTLKDSESCLRCVMFKSSALKLRFAPENGMKVTAFGRVTVYQRDGTYQLYCSAIIPEGIGDLQIAYEQLKARLDAEGLFRQENKKPLPEFPGRVAVITSSDGAAVHDIIRILGRRWPMAKVIVMPVRVQGTEAPPEICGAIRYANAYKVADVIITGRGGGSLEDLWAFNDERVARSIYNSHIPVISAVGHEPDVTISDYTADKRASTPSNAAEIAVPEQEELHEYIENLTVRLQQSQKKLFSRLRDRLSAAASKRVLTDPTAYFSSRRMELDRLSERLEAAYSALQAKLKQRFVYLSASLDALSPLRVLGRGYSITTDETHQPVSSISVLKPGQRVFVSFSDGRAKCSVLETEGNSNG